MSFILTDPSSEVVLVGVTSSRLCKYAEGADFPFQVETLEYGVDNTVPGSDIHEADHG
jgi:hypothetical protein